MAMVCMRKAGMEGTIAASLVEYSINVDGGCDSADAWAAVVSDVFADFHIPLDTEEDDADASDIVNALRQCNALVGLPPPLPPPKPGDPVLAVLCGNGVEVEAEHLGRKDAVGRHHADLPALEVV